jgi:hypothetical protein
MTLIKDFPILICVICAIRGICGSDFSRLHLRNWERKLFQAENPKLFNHKSYETFSNPDKKTWGDYDPAKRSFFSTV